jgi:hypothetical protein
MSFVFWTALIASLGLGALSRVRILGVGIRIVVGTLSALYFLAALGALFVIFFVSRFQVAAQ